MSTHILNKFNLKLENSGLFSFQHRIINKLLTFAYKIKNNPSSPQLLKNELTNSTDLNESLENVNEIRLRNRLIVKIDYTTRYSSLCFSYFFNKLIKNFSSYFELEPNLFYLKICNDISKNFSKFINLYSNLNITFNSFCNYKKKSLKKH